MGSRSEENGPPAFGSLGCDLEPCDPVGSLTTLAARELGLPSGILVGPGTGDNMAAALGLGLRSGDVALSLGTSGTVFAVSVSLRGATNRFVCSHRWRNGPCRFLHYGGIA